MRYDSVRRVEYIATLLPTAGCANTTTVTQRRYVMLKVVDVDEASHDKLPWTFPTHVGSLFFLSVPNSIMPMLGFTLKVDMCDMRQ